ncbi:MAG: Mrp family chromosome partitioning ATPase [Candidatus Poriferisodalaceae bacterium]|jgi:Mrp family chromosome partitioning ATPase
MNTDAPAEQFPIVAEIAAVDLGVLQPASVNAPSSAAGNAYRQLTGLVRSSLTGLRQPSLAVVGPAAGTGRTTIAVNIAAALVADGVRALLVTPSAGVIDIPNLHVLPINLCQVDDGGQPIGQPDAQQLRDALDDCASLVDVVIFDTESCDRSSWAYTAAAAADLTLVSVMTNRTPLDAYDTMRDQLMALGVRVLGVAVNAEAQVPDLVRV